MSQVQRKRKAKEAAINGDVHDKVIEATEPITKPAEKVRRSDNRGKQQK